MRRIDVSKLEQLFGSIASDGAMDVVHVQRDGSDVAVVLPPERYLELLMKRVPPNVRPEVVELLHESMKKNRKLYEALAKLG
jgi:hypothetical protein